MSPRKNVGFSVASRFFAYFASEYTASLFRKSPESTGLCFALIEIVPRTLWNREKYAGSPHALKTSGRPSTNNASVERWSLRQSQYGPQVAPVARDRQVSQLRCRPSYAQAGCIRHSDDQSTRNCRCLSDPYQPEVLDARSSWPWHLQTSFPECHLQLPEQRLHPAHRSAGRTHTSYPACGGRRDTRALAHPDK